MDSNHDRPGRPDFGFSPQGKQGGANALAVLTAFNHGLLDEAHRIYVDMDAGERYFAFVAMTGWMTAMLDFYRRVGGDADQLVREIGLEYGRG